MSVTNTLRQDDVRADQYSAVLTEAYWRLVLVPLRRLLQHHLSELHPSLLRCVQDVLATRSQCKGAMFSSCKDPDDHSAQSRDGD